MTDTETLTARLSEGRRMNTVAEINTALEKLEALMADRGIKAPSAEYTFKGSKRNLMWLASSEECFDGNSYKGFYGIESVQDAIQAAFDYIYALPDPETAARTSWHKDLAGVIDRGWSLNLPDEVMTPLRQGSQAMTENLLTKEPTA